MKSSNRLISKTLHCSSIDINDLNKLLTTSTEINIAAKNFQFEHEKNIFNNAKLTEDTIRKHIEDFMVVKLGIWGTNGEYTAFRAPNQLDSKDLPEVVKRIRIENSSDFESQVKRRPIHEFEIMFDCASTPPFDISTSVSSRTPNESALQVMGVNDTWVEGAAAKFTTLVEKKKKYFGLLHASSTYDIALWYGFAPAMCMYLGMLDQKITIILSGKSVGFQALVYLIIFFMLLILFRIFFGFLRWLFPYIEIKDHSNRSSFQIRSTAVFLAGALWLGAFYDVIKSIFVSYFKSTN